MKSTKTMWMLVACVAFAVIALSASASNVYLDEDFEGAAAFVDRNWPIKDNSGTTSDPGPRSAAQLASAIAVKGINLRTYGEAAEYVDPKVVINGTGSVTSERFFLGTKSYKLASGQTLAPVPGQFPQTFTNHFRTWQFAVSTDGDSAAKSNGTKIGHFKIDQSTDGTNTTVEATTQINFVSNGSGVDIICQNNSTKIGTLSGSPGDWALITVVEYHNGEDDVPAPASAERWRAVDQVAQVVKGPNGTILDSQIPTLADGDNPNFYHMPFGMNIFINSQAAPATTLNRTELGAAWGTPSTVVNNSPHDIGWQFSAENGGVLYVDNINWNGCSMQNRLWGTVEEAAARILEFDTATSEPTGPKEADAKSWWLY